MIADVDYPFKSFVKCQLDAYGKAVAFFTEMEALEKSGRDAEARLNVKAVSDRLDRMIISVRQIKKCSEEVEKILAQEMLTQVMGEEVALNLLDYRMDRLFVSLTGNECFQDVVSLKAQHLGVEITDALHKAAAATEGLHAGERSWKKDIPDDCSLADIVAKGEKVLSSVNGEGLMAIMKQIEEDGFHFTACAPFKFLSSLAWGIG